MFIAPYLLVTIIFTVGVILFALYISFTSFDLYTAPTWVGLDNYVKALDLSGKFIIPSSMSCGTSLLSCPRKPAWPCCWRC
jgi:multiple sugar transport system permease protein